MGCAQRNQRLIKKGDQVQNLSISQNQVHDRTHFSGVADQGTQQLEQMVGTSLLADLNEQLTQISQKMAHEVTEKRTLRQEIETIYQIDQQNPPIEADGKVFHDLSPEETQLLNLTETAIPQEVEGDKVTLYRVTGEQLQESSKQAVKIREGKLQDINSDGELTMLKIQSLVDQRKNILNLMSNLLAADNSVAQNIIQNIRG